jgi:hypothetical protein
MNETSTGDITSQDMTLVYRNWVDATTVKADADGLPVVAVPALLFQDV